MGAVLLSACASSRSQLDAGQARTGQSVAGHPPSWAGGEPATVSQRRNIAFADPPVFETQPARHAKLLTDEEQKRLHADLVATRNRTIARAKAATAAEKDPSSSRKVAASE